MGAQELELHIALSLLPYLDVTDICVARRVNKHWNDLFSSPDLLRAALRIHGSASREHQILNRLEEEAIKFNSNVAQFSPSDYLSMFRNFAIRTNNLRQGTPIQEIRFPVRRVGTTGNYVYAIADDVLVYLSPESFGLNVVFWNHDTSQFSRMQIELGNKNQGLQPSVYSVRRLRVFENILTIEHTKEVKWQHGSGTGFLSMVQVFKLNSPFADDLPEGQERPRQGSYEQLSIFETFLYRFVNYTDSIISDHSQTHYAALSTRSSSLGVAVCVWDLYTGQMVFKFDQQALGIRDVARTPVMSLHKVIMVGDSHILLIKPDIKNGEKWRKVEDDPTGFKIYVMTFSLNVGEKDENGVVVPGEEDYIQSCVTRDRDDPMLSSFQDHILWRVVSQRAPKTHHHDHPKVKHYLNLWGRHRIARMGKGVDENDEEWSSRPVERNEIHQYELRTDLPPGELPIRAVYVAINDNIPMAYHHHRDPTVPKPSMSQILVGNDSPFYLNSNGTDALSFDMVWSGGSSECLGTRLMTFYFGIRSFQLTETSSAALRRGAAEPLRYHLDYSSYLKQQDNKKEVREIPSVQRNVLAVAQSNRGMVVAFDVHGDERMSVYTAPRDENNVADLVMCVWGSEKLEELVSV